ncbi:YgfZ/GcvT domain-containing protein [Phreatobacter stygius]|uniref:Folate-binding protein YgfZ n=1 Tax=Phreatobacter stygius TaxID=1940610 RepID=A0A4D7B4M1_9HYPH|nr:folate-binding protein YgfZ [Phreatobacter stygius]QCI66145.1 folate-binding protein YgfZ [Phreatobacter stygius]
MHSAFLPDRGVVKLTGDDAVKLLQGLVTCDVDTVGEGSAGFGALLTPQGKIVADFFIIRAPAAAAGGLILDAPRALTGDLVKKLNFYKLRAKVTIEDRSDSLDVTAVWGTDVAPGDGTLAARDPRHPKLGWRVIGPWPSGGEANAAAYHAHRIALGIPEGGKDFAYGDAFPHEVDMDQLSGVAFDKGCFIGQEVVSRMQHRGTARTRVVPVRFDGPAPEAGLEVTAGDKLIGHMGSATEGRGLAKLRLDRIEDALAAGLAITAGGIVLTPVKPDWARFAWPGETALA